jgi:hypothetical protein
VTERKKRTVRPWQSSLDTNRKKRARVERAIERGEYTPPGTKPNARNEAKVARKRAARAAA